MTEYDDHDYCLVCNKHTIECYCCTGLGPGWPELDAEDKESMCLTPGQCGPRPTEEP